MRIAFSPEGGKLITGESCVVGFKSTNEKGEPLAVRCKIVDDKKNIYGEAIAFHEGRGSFEMIPEEGYQVLSIISIGQRRVSLSIACPYAKRIGTEIEPASAGISI